MFIKKRTNKIDAEYVWNVLEPDANRGIDVLKIVRTVLNMSPNYYSWYHRFNDRISEDREKRMEEENERRVEWLRQQAEESERFVRPAFSVEFKEKLRIFVKSLDPDRKLLGRPSCSFDRWNRDEYCDGELCLESEVIEALNEVVKTSRSKKPEAEVPGSSVIKHTSSSPPPAKSRKSFPNPKSEQIYNYVEEVIECYQKRRDEYVLRRVFPQLDAYLQKTRDVEVAFTGNVMGIRDKFTSDTELASIDEDISTSSIDAHYQLGKLKGSWKACNENFSVLETIKKKMAEGCLDIETLQVGRELAMELVNSLKRAERSLVKGLQSVRNIYGVLCEVQAVMKASPIKKS